MKPTPPPVTPPPGRRLTDAGREQLNRLLREGVPAAQALRDPSLTWEEVIAAPPAPPPRFDPALLEQRAARFTTTGDVDLALTSFFDQLASEGLVSPDEREGVPPREIDRVEARRGLLPYAYRRFVELAGARRCRLFSYSHFGFEFASMTKVTPTKLQAMGRIRKLDLRTLAPDALVVMGFLAEAWWFVRTTESERLLDSPVFCVAEDAEPRVAYPSVVDWLEGMHSEALKALRSGYFNVSPNGTSA